MVAEMMLRDKMRDEHQQLQQRAVRQKTLTSRTRGDRRLRPRLAGQHIAREYHLAAIRQAEYRRLKAIVPSVADKKSVTKVRQTHHSNDSITTRPRMCF